MRIEVKTLPARVHAGVRASAPVNADFFARDVRETLFENVLNREPATLTLPAVKIRAVVSDDAAVARESFRDRVERFFARGSSHTTKKESTKRMRFQPDFSVEKKGSANLNSCAMETLLTGKFIAGTLGAEWRGAPAPEKIAGAAIDSRKLAAGEIFVAIKTANRDGHDFLETARERGAAGALVSRFVPEVALPQLVVPDTVAALQKLAAAYSRAIRSRRECRRR